MLGFHDPDLYHANGKIYGRVSSGTKVVEAPPGERVRRDGLLAVCVVSALSLVLATTSVVLNVVVTRQSSVAQTEQQRSLRVCLPCYEVRGSKPKESDLESLERLFQFRKKKWSEGTGRMVEELDKEEDEMCCADDANQLETLLNEILDEKKETESEDNDVNQRTGNVPYPVCDLSSLGSWNGTACLLPESLSLNPAAVAAHLVSFTSSASAAPKDSSADTAGDLTVARWNFNSRRSFCRGLNCNSAHLLPSLPGFYFVYSQVSFSFSSNLDGSFTHFIKRFNTRNPNGGVEILFQHSSTIRGYTPRSSSSSSSSFFHPITDSSFLGGLIKVYPNDKLYVEVSHSHFLRSLPTATFFGMFKLS